MNTFSRAASLTLALAFAAGAAQAASFQQQVAADPRGEVDVSNIAGSIVITGWDKPSVSVTADVPSGSQRVKVSGGHGRTLVCVTYHSGGCNASGSSSDEDQSVRLEIYVPSGSEIEASGVSADITSRNVTGHQHLHTVSGDIEADLGSGNDEVKSVSGDIHLRGSGQDGTLQVSTVSGDLTVTNVAGELEARTVNGELRAGLSSARIARLNTTSGGIELNARLATGGNIEIETVSGREKADVAAPAGYAYEASSFSGDIDDCFGQKSDHNQYGPGSRLDGTRGAGSGHVRIRSLSGDISLCDH
ncbi:MAG TPA: DUF4097 family beta strand repeat-containing protein [Steroidobacteraceae bacterium]|nr:DUF4097 family beta strand repeat-containing protein [Steroidobacteraceae bacterium]